MGDEIIVTNEWCTLTYEVTAMDIIDPSEISPLLIQEGKDMITIVTCHPYRAPRDKRYVLYAERLASVDLKCSNEFALFTNMKSASELKYIENQEQLLNKFGRSLNEIVLEKWIRKIVGFLIIFSGQDIFHQETDTNEK